MAIMGRSLEHTLSLSHELVGSSTWTRRLARSLLGDESAADDAAQEAWLSVQRSPPAAGRPLGPWIRAVVRNRLLNRARQDRRRGVRERRAEGELEPAGADSPEDLLARLEIHKVLVDSVGRLGEPYRQTVLLRYFEGLSSAEIAARENIPAGTVRSRLHTAMGELRESLEQRYGSSRAWMAL